MAGELPRNLDHGRLAARSWGQGGSGATWEQPRGLLDGSNGPYLYPGQLWQVNDPATPTMAALQPDLGTVEGLGPLESDLEGCWIAQLVRTYSLDSFGR